jgi:type II secretory ATPase GspE/PulE/Tfp pilus assembly ATPase PilB-like protein
MEALGDDGTAWEGEGCEACRYTGYRGRSVVSEIMPVSAKIRELIQDRAPADRIKELARREGMRTLRDSALEAVRQGKTTFAEALKVTQQEEE